MTLYDKEGVARETIPDDAPVPVGRWVNKAGQFVEGNGAMTSAQIMGSGAGGALAGSALSGPGGNAPVQGPAAPGQTGAATGFPGLVTGGGNAPAAGGSTATNPAGAASQRTYSDLLSQYKAENPTLPAPSGQQFNKWAADRGITSWQNDPAGTQNPYTSGGASNFNQAGNTAQTGAYNTNNTSNNTANQTSGGTSNTSNTGTTSNNGTNASNTTGSTTGSTTGTSTNNGTTANTGTTATNNANTGWNNLVTNNAGTSNSTGTTTNNGTTTGSTTGTNNTATTGTSTGTTSGTSNTTGASDQTGTGTSLTAGRNTSTVNDTLGFGKLLQGAAGTAQANDASRTAFLNDVVQTGGSGFNSQVDQAVRNAISGPQMTGSGESARARAAGYAGAEIGRNNLNARIGAANSLTGPTSLTTLAGAAQPYLGQTNDSLTAQTTENRQRGTTSSGNVTSGLQSLVNASNTAATNTQNTTGTSSNTGTSTNTGATTNMGTQAGESGGTNTGTSVNSNVGSSSNVGTQTGTQTGTNASNTTGSNSNTGTTAANSTGGTTGWQNLVNTGRESTSGTATGSGSSNSSGLAPENKQTSTGGGGCCGMIAIMTAIHATGDLTKAQAYEVMQFAKHNPTEQVQAVEKYGPAAAKIWNEIEAIRYVRDAVCTQEQRRGYYILSEKWVPVFKDKPTLTRLGYHLVVRPQVNFGNTLLGNTNKAPISTFAAKLWLKVFGFAATKEPFVRNNGEVV